MKRRKQDDFNEQDEPGRGDGNEKKDKPEPNDGSSIFDEFGNKFPKDLAMNILSGLVMNAAKKNADDAPMDMRFREAPSIDRKSKKGDKITIDAVLAYDEPEQFPGTTRNSLAVQGKKHTFGTSLCKSLTDDLEKFYDDLLFGLMGDIYLHHMTSFSFANGKISVEIMIFWSPRESPHRLVTPNVTDITENQELVYLIVGDLVGDLLNQIENDRKEGLEGQ